MDVARSTCTQIDKINAQCEKVCHVRDLLHKNTKVQFYRYSNSEEHFPSRTHHPATRYSGTSDTYATRASEMVGQYDTVLVYFRVMSTGVGRAVRRCKHGMECIRQEDATNLIAATKSAH